MPETPVTRYVAVGDADVAYQAVGDADLDLLYFHGAGSHFEHFWDMPEYAAFLARLMKLSRLILFDHPELVETDDVPRSDVPTWEEWTEDVRAVLDDQIHAHRDLCLGRCGSDRVHAVRGHASRAGRRPRPFQHHRASYLVADDYPIGVAPEVIDAVWSSWWAKHGEQLIPFVRSIRAGPTIPSSCAISPEDSGPRATPPAAAAHLNTSGAASMCARRCHSYRRRP